MEIGDIIEVHYEHSVSNRMVHRGPKPEDLPKKGTKWNYKGYPVYIVDRDELHFHNPGRGLGYKISVTLTMKIQGKPVVKQPKPEPKPGSIMDMANRLLKNKG